MEPTVTLLMLFVSIGLGLAGAAGVLELIFVLMAAAIPASEQGSHRHDRWGASREF